MTTDMEKPLYDDNIQISQHTCRPVVESDKKNARNPVFWCETCTLKLNCPSVAIQHLNSKIHKKNVAHNELFPKRKLENGDDTAVPDDEAPPIVKRKKVSNGDYPVTCEECCTDVTSAEMMLQHVQGKKHMKKLMLTLPQEEVQLSVSQKVKELSDLLGWKKAAKEAQTTNNKLISNNENFCEDNLKMATIF